MNPESNTASKMDELIETAVFDPGEAAREKARDTINGLARERGIYPASIQGLYEAAGRGLYHGITVPAINIRGVTYQVARAVFRAAIKAKVGAFSFEIARSEIGYTKQRPAEYTASIMAAAVREGFRGPVFIQGDHFQVKQSAFGKDPATELGAIKDLVKESVEAGFYNIDIDASTVVDIDRPTLAEQQELNSKITAELTQYIRSIEPAGITVSVGGEIGEIGKGNSTVADLNAFMEGYQARLGSDVKGISKISVQTGTTHGGVVLPDGSIARVKIDFDTLKELSRAAREAYGMGGAVQHGASTLPDEAFDMFPKVDTVEVHLATGFQNIIYDSPHFPAELTAAIRQHLDAHYADERKSGETEEQFIYKTRKKALGDFKAETWHLPAASLAAIMKELEERFSLIFGKLNVVDSVALVAEHTPAPPAGG
jgi:fructose/tagatose bisphosphate aldolase